MDWTERRKELTTISDALRNCVRHLNQLLVEPTGLGDTPAPQIYDYIGPTSLQEPEQEGFTVLGLSQGEGYVAIFSVQDEEEAANWVTRMNFAYARGVKAQSILVGKLVKEGQTYILDRLENYLEDDSGEVSLPAGDTDRSALAWVRRFRRTL